MRLRPPVAERLHFSRPRARRDEIDNVGSGDGRPCGPVCLLGLAARARVPVLLFPVALLPASLSSLCAGCLPQAPARGERTCVRASQLAHRWLQGTLPQGRGCLRCVGPALRQGPRSRKMRGAAGRAGPRRRPGRRRPLTPTERPGGAGGRDARGAFHDGVCWATQRAGASASTPQN